MKTKIVVITAILLIENDILYLMSVYRHCEAFCVTETIHAKQTG